MTRIAIGIEYNGHEFFGWQSQDNLLTVQGTVEAALSKIAAEPIQVFCAGRTDAGVHATGQVVHFNTQAERSARAWTLGTNTHLPVTVAAQWAIEVDENFHARFSAQSRCYRYVIYNSSLRSAICAFRATWYHHALDAERMHTAAQFILGENDFSSFRSSECESKTPMRNVHSIQVKREGDFVIIEIQANAFLHHMVRNIAGVLMRIGAGFNPPEWMREVLQAKDRRAAAETAAPYGLYLFKVGYPDEYNFPLKNSSLLLF
jgi:tRNA pseudouridine38-40 synthase